LTEYFITKIEKMLKTKSIQRKFS